MKARALALVLLTASGCDSGIPDTATPPEADIQRVEVKLSQHPCVGNLDLWERNYRFSRKPSLLWPHSLYPDFDVIEFHFRRAGTIQIQPGLKVMTPAGDWPDSAPIQALEGRFTLGGGALDMARCKPAGQRSG